MSLDPHDLPEPVLAFLIERHLATLTTLRPDGTPHVAAVGFTYDPVAGLARVITDGGSRKARNIVAAAGDPVRGRAVLAQIDGARWLALEGPARVAHEPDVVADAVARYAVRYRQPRVNPSRVALLVQVDRVLGRG